MCASWKVIKNLVESLTDQQIAAFELVPLIRTCHAEVGGGGGEGAVVGKAMC